MGFGGVFFGVFWVFCGFWEVLGGFWVDLGCFGCLFLGVTEVLLRFLSFFVQFAVGTSQQDSYATHDSEGLVVCNIQFRCLKPLTKQEPKHSAHEVCKMSVRVSCHSLAWLHWQCFLLMPCKLKLKIEELRGLL